MTLWNQGGLLTSNGYVRQDFLDVPVGALQTFTLNATGRYLIIGARHEGSCVSTCIEEARTTSSSCRSPRRCPSRARL